MKERALREKDFHNKRFSEEVRYSTAKYYKITKKSHELFRKTIFNNCKDKKVLEIGCSKGYFTREIASFGAEKVIGIDISDVAISIAKKTASEMGINNVEYLVKDGSAFDFDNNSFDIVCGGAILHHLEFEQAVKSIARVLKKNGFAIFIEPLGHNPFINLYRKLTPQYRSPDESPLTKRDIDLFYNYFRNVEIKYFYLLTLFAVPFHKFKFFDFLVDFADYLDKQLFKIKFMGRFAWQMVIILKNPIAVNRN